jgi:hypothetical protein
MTEHLRGDACRNPEQSRMADANPEKGADRSGTSDTPARAIVTPPPGNPPAANVTGPGIAAATARAQEEERTALFGPDESKNLHARWDSIQVGFVDEPRKSVQEADALVSTTIKRLSEMFAAERQNLEQQWDRNENVSTEDFRIALRRYRSFFSRLLAI